MINSLRFSFVRTNESAFTAGETAPLNLIGAGRQDASINAGGVVGQIGADGVIPFFQIQNKFTLADDIDWEHGSHSTQAGLSVVRVQTNISAPFSEGGEFSFGTLENFLNGFPVSMLGMSAPSPDFTTNRYFREIDLFPYFQDNWKVTPRLTVNLGLRYDYATNAVGKSVPLYAITDPLTSTAFTRVDHVLASNPNVLNFDPRFGLAFDPFKDHKTSIRAGFGIFHEPVAARTYASAYYLAPPSATTILLNGALFGGPPMDLLHPYTGFALPYTQFAGIDYHTDTSPYVMQYNLTIQREIGSGITATVAYVGSSGVHLFSQRDQNLTKGIPAGTGPIGSPTNPFSGVETNPSFSSVNNAAASSHSTYHSFQASLNRQLRNNLVFQASYTWSKCIDDGSATTSLEQGSYAVGNPYNQGYDRGPCTFNIGQTFRINAVYAFPFKGSRLLTGWQLSGIAGVTSGLPVNIQTGVFRTNLIGVQGDRPNHSNAPGCSPDHITGSP
ncbi:MAG TPA: TonB-dependent receptor, partial [Blastocatellia bacterium]|nr:TonB-dependent receptor [Blastocatellia bacterium]